MEIALNVVLHANQLLVHRHPARNKCIKAGKRFGKTKWLLYSLLQIALDKPNQVVSYLAPTYRQAKAIAWWELNWLVPQQIIRRKVENELFIEFINGSRLQLLGCDNKDSLRGPKWHFAGMDEVAYVDQDIYGTIVIGQLAGSNGQPDGGCYMISSPNDKGKNWFTDFHADKMKLMNEGSTEWGAWYFTIYDNPTLSPETIEKIKYANSDDRWELEYLAKESAIAGQLFSEFDSKENVEEKMYDGALPLVRGLDWGISHPTVCLWLQYDLASKRVWVIDEFFKTGFVIQESCEWIKKLTAEKPVEWSVIDPSTNKRNSQTTRTDKDEFQRWGVPCVGGDNRDRGYDIVKMFLKQRLLKIHPKCKNLIYQLKNLQYGDKEGDDCCLIPGTKVFCKDGWKNIEDVNKTDQVLTRDGFMNVKDNGKTGNFVDIWQLKTSNGKTISGTWNHPVFLSNGKVKNLSDLEVGEELFDIRCYLLMQLGIWQLKSYLKPFKNLTESVTTFAENISSVLIKLVREQINSIELFGNSITEVFLKNSIFITETGINTTIRFPTLSCYQGQRIYRNTQDGPRLESKSEKLCEKLPRNLQQNGTEQRLATNSIYGLESKAGKIKNWFSAIVISAADHIKRHSLLGLNFVTKIVSNLLFGPVAAASVTHLPTKLPVYNLTINGRGEYIANGILVHNTDSLRYALVRIHDLTFGGNVFSLERSFTYEPQQKEINFNDPNLFPAPKVDNNSWLLEECA